MRMKSFKTGASALLFVVCSTFGGLSGVANAALITDPDDARTWQGANVGTFATLFFGSNTLLTRQMVVAAQLLDDGLIDVTGATAAPMISSIGVTSSGTSTDLTGTGSFGYFIGSSLGIPGAGNLVDEHWLQTNNTIGHSVWDLGAGATKAAIFNTIDHGPLPGEAIESTVYLSNDLMNWTQAVTQRIWLEGFMSNTGIKWDGFAYAVGTIQNTPFRYASIIWGGPGSLIQDGDNEINGVLRLNPDFTTVPEPSTLALIGMALLSMFGFGMMRRRADI